MIMSKKRLIILLIVALLTFAGIFGGYAAVRVWQNEKARKEAEKIMEDYRQKYTRTYRIIEQVSEKEQSEITDILTKRANLISEDAKISCSEDSTICVFLPGGKEEEYQNIISKGKLVFAINYGSSEEEAILTGKNVKSATVEELTDYGYPRSVVNIQFDEEGTAIFADVTKACLGQQIAIVFDGELIMSPTITAPITEGFVQISGIEDRRTAERMAVIIDSGELHYTLEEVK